jgi:hypothetical protein
LAYLGGKLIEELGSISLSRLYLADMLDNIAASAMEALEADACAILLLDDARTTLILRASRGLSSEAVNHIRLPKGRGISWRIVREQKPVTLARAKDAPDFFNVPQSGEDRFSSMMGVPIMEGSDCLGLIYVQTVAPKDYHDDDIALLQEIASLAAGSIQAGWHIERTQEKVRFLTALNDMSRRVNATDDIAEISGYVTRCASEVTQAKTQVIWTVEDHALSLRHFPEATGDTEYLRPVREGIAAHVMKTAAPVKIDDITHESAFDALNRVAARSVLCHPIMLQDEVLGVILLADRVSKPDGYFTSFTQEESSELSDIAAVAAQAIHRSKTRWALALALAKNERNARELSILFELSGAMQQAISLDDLLAVILSCVTVGEGLGFNRAMLFLVNENAGTLSGILGLGPDTGEGAAQDWKKTTEQLQSGAGLVKWLLNRDPDEIKRTRFNTFAASLRLSLSSDMAPARAVRSLSAVNVTSPAQMTAGDRDFARALGCDRFAVIPLIARESAVGAILVDNLYNDRPIADEDLALLARFSAPTAWALENMRLVDRLSRTNRELITLESRMAQVERMSALGEVSAELAHEIKNPLTVIGGFARRLLSGGAGGSGAGYAGIIVQEVERLETLLQNTLDVTRGQFDNRKPTDLNQIVREVADLYWRVTGEEGIEMKLDLAADIEPVNVDCAQIKQALINLTINAVEAMSCKRHKLPRRLSIATAKSSGEEPGVTLTICDTGGGIAQRDMPEIFNPFFTTKPTGTGLGLSLCRKIVRLHRGVMEIDNRLGVGVTFTLTLPKGA